MDPKKSPAAKLVAFAIALALLFGGGALAGGAIDPDPGDPEGEEAMAGSAHGAAEGSEVPARPVRGLGMAEGDLRIELDRGELRRGRAERIRFRIVDDEGTVRTFDLEHEKRMHVIVARRDLTAFQHLHPRQARDGSWSTTLRLEEPGSYRLFADFSHDGRRYTLAAELSVDGAADLRALPAPARVAESGAGYRVRLEPAAARAGREAELRFSITRDGRAVRPERYLGAGGHLVALREGDLAFLHVHPSADGRGDGVGFDATFPTPARYRLFLQFRHEGRIHTAAFTREVR